MNKVIIHGRLTKDPIIGNAGAVKFAKSTLAVDRKGKEGTSDFINITAFSKVADTFEKYCGKGRELLICGHIQTGAYTNKEGKKVYTTDVIVDEFDFCGSKADAQASDVPEGFTAEEEDSLPFN